MVHVLPLQGSLASASNSSSMISARFWKQKKYGVIQIIYLQKDMSKSTSGTKKVSKKPQQAFC